MRLLAFGCFVALIGLFFYAGYSLAPRIEDDVSRRVTRALHAQRLDFAAAEVSGRDVTLQGNAPDEDSKLGAHQVARGVPGVRVVFDRLQLSLTSVAGAAPIAPGQPVGEARPAKPLSEPLLPAPWTDPFAAKNSGPRVEHSISYAPSMVQGAGSTDAGEIISPASCQELLMRLLEDDTIAFQVNSADIAPDSFNLLSSLAQTARRCPNAYIEISGYTDGIGDPNYNKSLSQKRADAVMDFLVSHGVVPERLSSKGHGADKPVADNETPEGRAKNRRIELDVVNK